MQFRFIKSVIGEITPLTYLHKHATNSIYDVFDFRDGIPVVSVVDRPPLERLPGALHYHVGFHELIVVLEGEVDLWCGTEPDNVMPHRMQPGSMFLIPSGASHVFINGNRPARWMIMFQPLPGSPVCTREVISKDHTVREVEIAEATAKRIAAHYGDGAS